MGNSYEIPVLARTMEVIECISAEPEGVGFTHIVQTLGVPKTTVFRILKTLEQKGWIEKRGDKYVLGYMLIHYGMLTLSRKDLISAARPFLAQLTAEAGETSHLAVLQGTRSMIVEIHDSPHHIKLSSGVGVLLPLHCTSHGKVHLAFGVEEPVETYLKGVTLQGYTQHTITDEKVLRDEIQAVRQQGFALDDLEFMPDVRCCAAPVRGKEGRYLGAIGVTGTRISFTREKISEISARVITLADRLSRDLGHYTN